MPSAILLAANPTLARLQRYLSEQPTIRIPVADASPVELHHFCKNEEQIFEYAVRQTSEVIGTLEHLHNKWLDYLSNLWAVRPKKEQSSMRLWRLALMEWCV
ncbi:unnamed protein product [Gongylonema pulchrum]|uniref:ATP phosphoribosyltransferase n=1 Tax=Gongylonema pulchrum TaxID=637853 RepID=A0A183D4L3_9BILA|nr:unnamed protein product [Gongylonema pulchrum]